MTAALATLKERYTWVANEIERIKPEVDIVAPEFLRRGRGGAILLDALSRDPSLLECEPKSIIRTFRAAMDLGLEIGSPIGTAYVVPYENRKKGRKEASLIVGYKGFVQLAGGAFDPPRLVREKDRFEYEYGTHAKIVHVPGAGVGRSRGDVTHAYAIAHVTGRTVFDVMDRDELDKIKAGAKAKWGPWAEHTDEMFRKCPLRRLAKYIDLGAAMRKAIEVDDLESLRRGEMGPIREGFETGRAEELKRMVVDAEVVEEP